MSKSNTKFKTKILEDRILKQIIENSQDTQIYLVGGCIRDYILNKENFDKDIIVDCKNVREYAETLSKKIDCTFVPLDEENKIYRLVYKDKINSIDIAGIIGKNLEEDLKRRDFTINSVAIDLKTFETIDINSGIEDIEHGIIRGISDKNFQDDALRLLRAYRFHSTLGFEIDSHLQNIIDKNFLDLQKISIERINAELLKLFEGKYADKTLKIMGDMIELFFPIMKEVKKIPPNSHHHLPLFYHSIETVHQIQKYYETSSEEIKQHLNSKDISQTSRLSLLKISGFLHDIGKPQTWTIEEDTGRHRFIKHDDVGSKLVVPILKNLNFSKKQINYISSMIKNHIYPAQVVTTTSDNTKAYMRFIRKMEDNVPDVIILSMSDRLSARGPAITDEMVKNNIDGLKGLLDFYFSIKESLKPLPILLNGNEIMELFNLKPSKELGILIDSLKEAQISGEINTKEEAVEFVKNLLEKF